jgi:hypothetical protein
VSGAQQFLLHPFVGLHKNHYLLYSNYYVVVRSIDRDSLDSVVVAVVVVAVLPAKCSSTVFFSNKTNN